MRNGVALTASLGTFVAALSAAGGEALLAIGVVAATAAGIACWVIANDKRARNAVSLIIALKGRTMMAGQSWRLEELEPSQEPTVVNSRQRRRLRRGR